MPSRTLSIAIVVFWLLTAAWYVERVIWPRITSSAPPQYVIDLADEALRLGRSAEEVHFQEKLRREAIEELGWRVVRWGKAELREPERMRRRLLRAGLSLK